MKKLVQIITASFFIAGSFAMTGCQKDEMFGNDGSPDAAFEYGNDCKNCAVAKDATELRQSISGPLDPISFSATCGGTIQELEFDNAHELHYSINNTGACTLIVEASDSSIGYQLLDTIAAGQAVDNSTFGITKFKLRSIGGGGSAAGEMELLFDGDLVQGSNGTSSASGIGTTFLNADLNGLNMDVEVVLENNSLSDSELGAGFNIGLVSPTELIQFVGSGNSDSFLNNAPQTVGLSCTGTGSQGCYGSYRVYMGAEPPTPPVGQSSSNTSTN